MTRCAAARAANVCCLAFLALAGTVQAEVLFDGQWEHYLGAFYGDHGWQNVSPRGLPTGNDDWNDIEAFWSPAAIDNTWLFNMSWARDRIRLERDPKSPRGGLVARIEVRSGEHRQGVYSGERAEMYTMLGRNHQKLPVTVDSGHEYYAIAVKVSPDWQPPQPESAQKGHTRWGSFLQLHSPNAFNSPPALDLMAEGDFHLNMDAGDLDRLTTDPHTGQMVHAKNDSQPFALTNGDLRPGHWVQFVLDVVWAADNRGSLNLFRRDEGETDFRQVLRLSNVPTLQTDSYIPTDLEHCPSCATDNVVHYWRVGYYRSTSPGQTNVLWLGPVARATSFDEAASAALGSSGSRILLP